MRKLDSNGLIRTSIVQKINFYGKIAHFRKKMTNFKACEKAKGISKMLFWLGSTCLKIFFDIFEVARVRVGDV